MRRAFAGVDLRDLDPFIHLDQMGEVEYAPGEPKGTPWHPHRGFETVTYMIDGIMEHATRTAVAAVITNGDTQWMTAGAGILHIEKPPEHLVVSGGLFHGFQLWVNLPRDKKWADPRYQDLRADEVALVASPDGGALLRIIAGEVGGHRGTGLHVHADDAGPRHHQPRRAAVAALARGLQRPALRAQRRGHRRCRPATHRHGPAGGLRPGRCAHGARRSAVQESRSPSMDVLILGGLPIREPVAWMGPFVMNTREEVMQAFSDYQAGRLGSIPAVHGAPSRVISTGEEGEGASA